MAGDVTLSNAVRSNLLSLQNTADLLSRTQERLSTGKKVNSALDNPTNFFTASALTARSGDLNSLLDGVSNSIQALQAADKGITSITKLVESAQATARQALQTSGGNVAYNLSTYGSVAVAADTAASVTGIVNLRDDATDYGPAEATGSTVITNDTVADLAGETLTVSYGGVSHSITFGNGIGQVSHLTTADAVAADPDAVSIGLEEALTAMSTALGVTVELDADGKLSLDGTGGAAEEVDSFILKATSSNALSTLGFPPEDSSSPIVEIQADNLLKELGLKNGDTLTFQLGADAPTQTIVFGTGTNQINSRSGLETALQGLASLSSADTAVDGSRIKVTAANADSKLIIGGSAREEIFGASVMPEGIGGNIPTNTISQTNTELSLLEGQRISIQLGDGSVNTITLGTTNGRVSNRADLVEKLNAISPDLKASFDSGGRLKFASTSQYDLKISGNGASALGLQQKAYSPTATVNTSSSARESLMKDFNYTMSQITTLAQDASYNGINLLTKDNLKVTFNENGTSQLNIEGVDFTKTGLGLSDAVGDDFQKDATINKFLDKMGEVLTNLRTQASKFGSNLAIVETRQDFTKNLINVLDSGAANLTLADGTAEAANSLALQTRQSLGTTALSLSNQADQSILQLLR